MTAKRFTVWYAGDSQILGEWIVAHTALADQEVDFRPIAESDANKPSQFFRMPARIRDILYLDAPDLIVSCNHMPILSLEISTEAGTGHNAFQRFSRLAAAVERGVPALYIYPEAVWVTRRESPARWDRINPLIFHTLEKVMDIFEVPAFLYFFPSDYAGSGNTPPGLDANRKGLLLETDPQFPNVPRPSDAEMRALFSHISHLVQLALGKDASKVGQIALTEGWATMWRRKMSEYWKRETSAIERDMSPLTSTIEVSTALLLGHLEHFAGPRHDFGFLLPERSTTLIYQATGRYRHQGDPYTGALAAIDYLRCRTGTSYEDRDKNLVMAFGKVDTSSDSLQIEGPASVDDFVEPIHALYSSENKVLLNRTYDQLRRDIPRFMMQVRFGTTFTKRKDLRIFAYFCDAIVFPDGALWRES